MGVDVKAYCKNCQWLYGGEDYRYELWCGFPENLHHIKVSDCFEEHNKVEPIRRPEEINVMNNCVWFNPKKRSLCFGSGIGPH